MVFSTTRQTGILAGHIGAVHCIAYSAGSGTYALSGGADRKIYLWNPTSGTKIQTYTAHGYEVLSLACAHDNTVFASSGGDKLVFLWDVATAQTVRRFEGHWGRINAVAFNADASVLVSGSYDASVKLWDVRSQARKPVQTLDEARDSVSEVAVWAHDVVAASVDGRVRAYDLRMGRCVVDVVAPAGATSVCVARDGGAMLVGALDGVVRLMDRTSGGCLQSYRGHKNTEMRIRCGFAAGEEYVVSGSEDGEVWVWELLSGQVRERMKCHAGKVVTCVEYCPAVGKRQMLSGGADGMVVVWGE